MKFSEVWSFLVDASHILTCRYSVTLACTLLLTDLLPVRRAPCCFILL